MNAELELVQKVLKCAKEQKGKIVFFLECGIYYVSNNLVSPMDGRVHLADGEIDKFVDLVNDGVEFEKAIHLSKLVKKPVNKEWYGQTKGMYRMSVTR